MISVQSAAQSAIHYLHSLFPLASNPLIEEVEKSDDERYWLITIGFSPPSDNPFLPFNKREYKTFKINAETGEVISMKIRSLQA